MYYIVCNNFFQICMLPLKYTQDLVYSNFHKVGKNITWERGKL